MADYKKMYYQLFNCVTDAIEILKKGQIKSEEIFVNSDDNIKLLECVKKNSYDDEE